MHCPVSSWVLMSAGVVLSAIKPVSDTAYQTVLEDTGIIDAVVQRVRIAETHLIDPSGEYLCGSHIGTAAMRIWRRCVRKVSV